MTPNTDSPDKKKGHTEKPETSKKQEQKEDKDKFSPGEPDDYNAEEFSTD